MPHVNFQLNTYFLNKFKLRYHYRLKLVKDLNFMLFFYVSLSQSFFGSLLNLVLYFYISSTIFNILWPQTPIQYDGLENWTNDVGNLLYLLITMIEKNQIILNKVRL